MKPVPPQHRATSDAPPDRKFSQAACWLRVAARLNAAEPGKPATIEITDHFRRATAGLDREALVARVARAQAPNDAPPAVVAEIERQLWRGLLTFSGWPECLRHVEPEGRA
jgi:hypothetical protein